MLNRQHCMQRPKIRTPSNKKTINMLSNTICLRNCPALGSGNILEDSALLASLSQTKSKASNAAAALQQGAKLAAALDAQRDGEDIVPCFAGLEDCLLC